MRRRPFKTVLLCASLLVLAYYALVWADDAHTAKYRVHPEKVSPFLASYTPQPVIESFHAPGFNSWTTSGSGSSGDPQFVKNDRSFGAGFSACRGRRSALTAALEQDLLNQLRQNQATVLLDTRDLQNGVHMVYRLDRSLGVVHLAPISPDSGMRRATPLPNGLEDIAVSMTISETWFKTPEGAAHAFQQTHLP